MDTVETPRRRGRTLALVGAGLAGGVVLAGFATASAQTPTPTTPDTEQSAPAAPGRGRGGHRGPSGHGMGGIHGEFVTAAPDGGWQTVATQQGEVTAVSATSITVKSEDGFSRTYAVDDNTLVNAGNEGIADVAKGDDVRVKALVANGKAGAVSIDDGTQVQRLHERWAPRPPAPEAEATTSSAT
jgi:hypothetical protein